MIFIDKTANPYFKFLAGLLKYELGDKAEVSTNYDQYGTWILNFASFKAGVHLRMGRSPYIVLHTEQLSKCPREYHQFLECAQEVWSWSKEDLKLGDKVVKPLNFGYSDYYRLQMEEAKDIDILFVGSFNDKRFDIIGELSSKHRLVCARGFYGKEYMALVMRSKIVLSIHYYDFPQNDWPRIAPLLSVGACVVCQETVDEEFNALNGKYLCILKEFEIADVCDSLLKNPQFRLSWQDVGRKYIKDHAAPLQFV